MQTKAFLLAAAFFLAGPPSLAASSAQSEEATRAARAEMQKLIPLMQGKWTGTGMFRVSRETTVHTESEETIRPQLEGSALLIEGLHRDARSKVVVHHAMGLLAWDVGRGEYRMSTALSQGRTGYFPGRLEGSTFTWTMEAPGAPQTRYIIRLDPPGRWHEVGESSRDGGKTWFRFFEMTLVREPEGAASR
jgi:hypothetical protein